LLKKPDFIKFTRKYFGFKIPFEEDELMPIVRPKGNNIHEYRKDSIMIEDGEMAGGPGDVDQRINNSL
jgi:hypothetical protein